jgi:lipopolysaccharide/colanic/teichoic acid biosynthesis glycosyltransferase
VFSPVLLAAALAVWLEDGRPVLFRHVRVGRNGRKFDLLKFRSMRDGAGGPAITAGGDPRVTRVGRILRRYKLDELPQLWNVVRGDMALVGPRPEAPDYVDANDPVWRAVLRARPGITDLATLIYRNEEEILAGADDPDRYYRQVLLPAKLALNLRYAASRTPLSDLRLLALTLRYSFLPSGFDPARIERAFALRKPS